MLMIERPSRPLSRERLDTVAFKQDDGVIASFDVRDLANGTGAGKSLVDEPERGRRETMSACLPSCSRIMPQARIDPTASPSGRACPETRKALATFDGVQNCVDVVTSLHR